MKYCDLTIDQKIGLKGEFETNPKCYQYRTIMLLWNFKIAINYFLTGELSLLDLD